MNSGEQLSKVWLLKAQMALQKTDKRFHQENHDVLSTRCCLYMSSFRGKFLLKPVICLCAGKRIYLILALLIKIQTKLVITIYTLLLHQRILRNL